MSNNTNTNDDDIGGMIAFGVIIFVLFHKLLISLLPLIIMGFIMLLIIAFVTAVPEGNQNNRTENTESKPKANYTQGNQLITYHDGKKVWTGRREVEL